MHDDRGKAHIMMVSYCEMEIKETEKKAYEAEPDLLDALQVQNLFNFRNFYDQIDFIADLMKMPLHPLILLDRRSK